MTFSGLELAAFLLLADPTTEPNVVQANLLTQPGAIVRPIEAPDGPSRILTIALPEAVLTGAGTLTATLDFPGHPVAGFSTRTFTLPGPTTQLFLAFGTYDPCNCNYNQPPLEGVVSLSLDGAPAQSYAFGLQLPVSEPTTVLLVVTAALLVAVVPRAARAIEAIEPAQS